MHKILNQNCSVLILTKNEELDLPKCLASVAWSNDILIIDSESTDKTKIIAKNFGARFIANKFEGYSRQRNFGLSQKFINKWLLILDADEIVTNELHKEIIDFINHDTISSAARIRRRDIWMGTWLKHSQISPYFIRLVIPDKAKYERDINEVINIEGKISELSKPLDHFPFSKGIEHWIEKHKIYAKMEAKIIYGGNLNEYSFKKAFFNPDFNERRLNQKKIFYNMPLRPVIKFFYMSIVRRSFMDGINGVRYTVLQCIYEYFIDMYVAEHKYNNRKIKQ